MIEDVGPAGDVAGGLHPAWPVSVIVPYPQVRPLLFGRCAARSEQFGGNAAAAGAPVVIGSAAGFSETDVSVRARGELLERASNILSGRRAESRPGVVGCFVELNRRGLPVLDPACLPRGGAETRSAPMMWVEGRSQITGEQVFVPAGVVYLRHRPPAGCVAPVRAGSTGLAAHHSPQAAVVHAAREIIERDALVRAWYDDVDTVALRTGPPLSGSAAEEVS